MDPWEWIFSLVTDPALARVSTWKSRRCYYSEDGHRERFVNEPCTGDTWYNVDTELPPSGKYAHCWLPLHLWLDKGNGGGIIIGFMVMVNDPSTPEARNERETYEFAQFKREIYQQVLEIIFRSLYHRSWMGETVICGDTVARVLYPGFLIESLDFEEAWNFCCCRAGRANFPCPRCLIRQDLLSSLHTPAQERNTESMRAVIRRARAAPNTTQKEKILKDHGLHDITHFMWNIRFSDPYRSLTHDLPHYDESGKWAHHLWFTEIFKLFPRWRGLKHIDDPLTKDFADGQTHFDILKCVIFALTQLLPTKSTLLPCVRALLQFRMLAGLRVMTESRTRVIESFIRRYEACCTKVAEEHGKNFNFPKQHFTSHAVADIWAKGVLRNATTRTGEGIHQEVAQHYKQTNGRDAVEQISHRDEEQEAVAQTRLIVDEFYKSPTDGVDAGDEQDQLRDEAAQFRDGSSRRIPKSKLPPGCHADSWVLGSVGPHGDSRSYEEIHAAGDPLYRDFDPRLREFVRGCFPHEYLAYQHPIEIELFRCLYVFYQSKDDWTEGEDILRCNANWYRRGPRYDCLLFDSADNQLASARLQSLIRCKLPSGRIVDVAMVRLMRKSAWRPRNPWDGMFVLEEAKESTFILVDHIICGALLAPVRPPPSKPRLHFLVDVVDGDMFLRCLNATQHTLDWHDVRTQTDLITLRAQQFLRRDELLTPALEALRKSRERAIEDVNKRMRYHSFRDFEPGMWVWRHETQLEGQHGLKEEMRWSGPYVVHAKHPNSVFTLRELSGVIIRGTVTVHRLKLFFYRPDRQTIRSVISPSTNALAALSGLSALSIPPIFLPHDNPSVSALSVSFQLENSVYPSAILPPLSSAMSGSTSKPPALW
ncbi:hypothetical protein GGX14DRAFT_645516 [Mycena pura]|uniref:Uncharacterized protein n=1 Tax=Mycena pura TaxID=153505 RepID=A0AAD6V9T7_9AGAR|nr:hypothetical protein GGX14DRAFT_645516 [Mycena pura]